jgi:RimJ/RimL family protein N-acetyltransferase
MEIDCPSEACERGPPEETPLRLRGAAYLLRPLRPEDEKRLQEFFYSHSKETIQSRYGYMISTMTHERAFELVNVDQKKDVALGIFELVGDQQVLDAVGRYYSDRNGMEAEIAFVVREDKRRCGMASTLIRSLAEQAQKRGLIRFVANVLRDNEDMRKLFARYEPEVSSKTGSEWMTYHLAVEKILATHFPRRHR